MGSEPAPPTSGLAGFSKRLVNFTVWIFCGVSPKCQGLIINHGAILEGDLHFYNIVVPGEVKCWTQDHCCSSVFNEDGFRDETLAVIKTARPLAPRHQQKYTFKRAYFKTGGEANRLSPTHAVITTFGGVPMCYYRFSVVLPHVVAPSRWQC